MKVTVYGKPKCVQCRYTRVHLDKQGVDYTYIEVGDDTPEQEQAKRIAAEYHLLHNYPIVLVTNGRRQNAWSGFKLDNIKGLRKTGDY